MTIKTKSYFVYGITITSDNRYIDFLEGTTALSAELIPARYTLTTLARELTRALNSAGEFSYSCSIDRTTRKITVHGSGTFTFPVTTAPHLGSSAFPVAGFTQNKTGTALTSDVGIGLVYYPPRYLQDYLDPQDCISSISESVNESGDGTVEVFSLGEKNQCEFNIDYITNDALKYSSFLEPVENMIEKTRDFLSFLIKKGPIDFIPDRSSPDFYYTLILEKNAFSSKGTGFRLYKMSGVSHLGLCETKTMTFRVVNV